MQLQRGEVKEYDSDRMVFEFTMLNDARVIRCAIGSEAMDGLDGRRDVKADHRVDQFIHCGMLSRNGPRSDFTKATRYPIGKWCCDRTTSDGWFASVKRR
jgi:hypothetical protein